MKKRNKYNNKKIIIDNIKFDSIKEGNRYKELKLLEKAGMIVDLETQPKYLLQDKFKYNNKVERAIHYIADFRYIDVKSSQLIVEDTKGVRTEVFKIKRKIFLKLYGADLQFLET